jgi:hypothetical protein
VLLLVLSALLSGGCNAPPTTAKTLDLDAAPLDHAVDRTALDLKVIDQALRRPDGGSTAGEGCTSDWDCSAGLHCDDTMPDGLCTRPCSADTDCGPKERWGCHDKKCLERCNVRSIANPCRDKYACRTEGNRSLCVPDCRIAGCAEKGWSCDAATGLCVDPASGTIGAPCGLKTGACDGVPNGVCFTVSSLTDGFCTVPCSPFTKPCPLQLKNAQCVLGPATAPLCAFLCDPKAPDCPHPSMGCVSYGKDVHVCLPK